MSYATLQNKIPMKLKRLGKIKEACKQMYPIRRIHPKSRRKTNRE